MMRQRLQAVWLVVLGLMLLLGSSLQVYANTQINSVRLWRAPDNTRLVFDMTGPVRHEVFTLSNPERVVIDVTGAKLQYPLSQVNLLKSPIKSMRAAYKPSGELRVVLDVSAKVDPKSFTLAPNQQYGHRLVLDLFDRIPGQKHTPATQPPVVHNPVVSAPPKSSGTVAPIIPRQGQSIQGKRDIVVAIDAGHGGEDPGAIGPKGLREKTVVLSIAQELQRQINSEKGFRAELVRTGDYFIPLRKRTEIARKKGADLFVSIHADAAPRASAFGASVYALSDRGATSETARWLADSENQSDLIGGTGNVSLNDKDKVLAGVLLDLSMTASMSASLDVGQKILNSMGQITPLHKKRVEQAGFMVLKSPDIPSVLVETGFISNPNESQKLATRAHQQALARAIHTGVRQYFQLHPPPGTYMAWLRDSGKVKIGQRDHVVKPGESVSLIALRYQVSINELRRLNKLSSDALKVGQVLKIPATTLGAK